MNVLSRRGGIDEYAIVETAQLSGETPPPVHTPPFSRVCKYTVSHVWFFSCYVQLHSIVAVQSMLHINISW